MITAIIPARTGSKRIPDKNIRHLAGKPLVAHTILTAKVCGSIDRIIMTSDGYRDIAKAFDIEYLERPAALAADDVPDLPVIADVVRHFDLQGLVVYLRPTTPFRSTYHVEDALKMFESLPDVVSGLRSVHEMGESAYKCFWMHGGHLRPILKTWWYDSIGDQNETDLTDLPNQLVEPTYKPNGVVDIATVDNIKQGILWGDSVYGYQTPWTLEIDTPADWEYAEYLAQRRVDQQLKFGKENV